MTAALLDEYGRPVFLPAGKDHHGFAPLVAAGWPTVELLPRLNITNPVVVLAHHLDGSLWVLPRRAGIVCVDVSHVVPESITSAVTSHRVWRPVNPHQLTDTQVQILRNLEREREWGLTDSEHTGMQVRPSTIADARHQLVKKGLVSARTGPMARRDANGAKGSQVWVITRAGVDALVSPLPQLGRLLELARAG